MPETFDEVIADIFTVKNDNVPQIAWPRLTCGVANEVTFVESSLKLGDQREIFFQNTGQLRVTTDLKILTGSPAATEKLRILANGNVGIGTTAPEGKLDVRGDIRAGNSDIYFTKTDHNHTGIGNTMGFAAIENAANFGALMILGRSGAPQGRAVKLWDYLEVNGALNVTGNVGIGTLTPMRRLHVEPTEIHSGGSSSGYSFGDRGSAAFVTSPSNGERWVWYASSGIARLWSGGDKLLVTPGGSAGLNVSPLGIAADRVAFHIAGSLTPAYVLEDTGRAKKWGLFTSAVDGSLIFSDLTGFALHRLTIVPNGNVGIGTTFPTSKLHVAGDIRFTGNLIGGGKGGYVMDQFINRVGATLEQGDVVVIGKNQTALFYGPNNNIPIPEVDLAQRVHDGCVCGIVVEVYTELKTEVADESAILGMATENPAAKTDAQALRKTRPAHSQSFTSEELERLDRTKVESGQIGWMVTLGAFAHCKVDADIAPIDIGDLLTTSPTKGHAQKVLDPGKAAGAIVGKALGSLKKGKGKIPVIVMLQ